MNLIPMSPMQAKAPLFGAKKKETEAKRFIEVGGSGTVERSPDKMDVTLAVTTSGSKKEAVHRELVEKARRLFEAVKALSFPLEMQPSLNVQEKTRYDRNTGANVSEGFEGRYHLQLSDKVKKSSELKAHAEEIRKVAEETGADLHGPHFSLTPTRYKSAQKSADAKAYEDAKRSAAKVAQKGKFELANEPVDVKVGVISESRVPKMRAMAAAAPEAALGGAMADDAGNAGSVFEFKPIQVFSKPVQVVFEILTGKKNKTGKAKKTQ